MESAVDPGTGEASHEGTVERRTRGVRRRARRGGRGPRRGAKQHGRVGHSIVSPLRDARVARGLTLDEVGRKVGVSAITVARAEAGGEVSAETKAAIERAVHRVAVKQPETAGAAIRAARLAARLTLRGLATLTGYSLEHVSRVERGNYRPTGEFRARLFAELGTDLRRFFPDDEYPRSFGATEPHVEVLCEVGEDEDPGFVAPSQSAAEVVS
jgi:transcriptional regulator with XRE-family HTH domain